VERLDSDAAAWSCLRAAPDLAARRTRRQAGIIAP